MANTYSQIHIHVVFAVQNRLSLIDPKWKIELYKYISGCIRNYNVKLLAINGMPDHIHIFFGMKPHTNISELVKIIKANSSKWINESGFIARTFRWQEGFGCFSYSKADCPNVINYINRQEEHHRDKNFRTEYIELLEKFEVIYDERYLFNFIE